MTRGAEIVNAQGSDKDWWYLMVFDYLNQVHWHINMPSLIFKKACRDFKKSLYSNLVK